jgi:hypothetical protein
MPLWTSWLAVPPLSINAPAVCSLPCCLLGAYKAECPRSFTHLAAQSATLAAPLDQCLTSPLQVPRTVLPCSAQTKPTPPQAPRHRLSLLPFPATPSSVTAGRRHRRHKHLHLRAELHLFCLIVAISSIAWKFSAAAPSPRRRDITGNAYSIPELAEVVCRSGQVRQTVLRPKICSYPSLPADSLLPCSGKNVR